jgi:oligopeptide/dipeptide ABC transporter ATP-binding protein
MADDILQVKQLKTFFYVEEGIVKAVDDVSFSLGRGETLGIVGESGSGKTVTSLSLLRLIPSPPGKILSGEILFKGEDILKLSNKKLRSIRGNMISMIFQDPMTSLNPVFSIGDQIGETLTIHQGLDKKERIVKAVELLKDVGISNPDMRVLQFPHHFSGGMRQRAMIAMAMAGKPEILIADEPTTALDVTIQAQILELMNKMKQEQNNAIIIISHDLGVIAEMADKIIIMYAGKIVEYGDVDTIFYTPGHPYTWGLLDSIPKLEKKNEEDLIPIRGNPPSLLHVPPGCSFQMRCDYALDVCRKAVPVLRPINTAGHLCACHLPHDKLPMLRKLRKNGKAGEE